MRVGITIATFHTQDWPRVTAEDWVAPMTVPDAHLLSETRALGRLVEPLGFDSIWVGEHFGTPYSMWPTATQTLAYWAGQTERIDMGSCVVVLPWHQPLRLALGIAMLDTMLESRRFTLGVGRGVSKREYDAMGVDREEARGRFKEVWDFLKLALGDDITRRAVCAFSTPESMQMAAHEGFGQLLVTGAPLEEMSRGVDDYNAVRAGVGLQADRPRVLLWMYCTGDERAIERGYEYFAQNGREVEHHYGFTKPGAFDGIKGYEAYVELQSKGAPVGGAADQPIGRPETIIERLRTLQEQTGAQEVLLVPQFGGMTLAEAERSMRLFAGEVLPVIRADPAPARVLTPVARS